MGPRRWQEADLSLGCRWLGRIAETMPLLSEEKAPVRDGASLRKTEIVVSCDDAAERNPAQREPYREAPG